MAGAMSMTAGRCRRASVLRGRVGAVKGGGRGQEGQAQGDGCCRARLAGKRSSAGQLQSCSWLAVRYGAGGRGAAGWLEAMRLGGWGNWAGVETLRRRGRRWAAGCSWQLAVRAAAGRRDCCWHWRLAAAGCCWGKRSDYTDRLLGCCWRAAGPRWAMLLNWLLSRLLLLANVAVAGCWSYRRADVGMRHTRRRRLTGGRIDCATDNGRWRALARRALRWRRRQIAGGRRAGARAAAG